MVAIVKKAKWNFQRRACGVMRNAKVEYPIRHLVHPSFDL
jgi:hypothetical protein